MAAAAPPSVTMRWMMRRIVRDWEQTVNGVVTRANEYEARPATRPRQR